MPVDPRHGRAIPSGLRIARVLRLFFARQLTDVLARLRAGELRAPDLSAYTQSMAEALLPLVEGYYRDGATEAAWRLSGLAGSRKAIGPNGMPERRNSSFRVTLLKRRPARPPALFDLSQLNPRILDAARAAVLDFCRATNETARGDLQRALDRLRQQLAAGLEEGEALKELTARVQRIFRDPFRAVRIAQTEASRAVHAGQLLAAKESGVVRGKKWLASSDACPTCRDLDGKEVGLDEPFAVIGTGTYARIMHAPAHPACQCTVAEVLG